MTNDPYDGSTHLPDIVLVKPIHADGVRVGFSAALAHMTDIGGRIPGGNASDSTEIYQEGLRIPPSRVHRAGVPDENLFRLIERNVRVPDKVLGDIRSLIAACGQGERGILDLVALWRRALRLALPRPARLHRTLHPGRDRAPAQGHLELRRSSRQ